VSPSTRRFFWGHTLAQAVASAARHYQLAPERLDYRIHGKRHGFVRHPRAVVIEIDPASPARRDSSPLPVTAPRASAPTPRIASPAVVRAPSPAPPEVEEERWAAPDDESEAAVHEALRQLGRLAGFELGAHIARTAERFEIELTGIPQGRVDALGLEFVEELEHLLPRAVFCLSGRRVRCRLDMGGLRAAREEALRARAREAAARVLSTGEPELLEPLNPAERRIVHLALLELGGVATESLGSGFLKRVQISRVPGTPG
jgi:spoIIIJ-associated protein